MLFVEMPSSRPHHQRCRIRASLILLSLRTLIANRSSNRVPQIVLTFDIVAPGGSVRILEVRHKDTGARVQGVDDHLAIDRAGNFHATIEKVFWDRRHL